MKQLYEPRDSRPLTDELNKLVADFQGNNLRQAADQEAVNQIMGLAIRYACLAARRLAPGRDASFADDIGQRIGLCLLGNFESFKNDSKFTTWLSKCVLNEIRTIARKEARGREMRFSDIDGLDNDDFAGKLINHRSGDDPSCKLERDDDIRLFRRAYAKLPSIQRKVIDGRLRSLTYEEISLELRVPVGTVRSRVSRAYQGIANFMGAPTTPGRARDTSRKE